MKYRAKGLVFVGFAAAILASAGGAMAANPTGAADVVTSQKYTEATYQHILGGSNTSGKLVQMNSNDTGDVKYIAISDSASDVDSSANAGGLVSGRAVGLAMDELESALNNFTTNLSGDGTYTQVQQVAANGDNPNAPGYVPAHKEVQIITNNLAKTSADVTSTATGAGDKLATASAVKAYAQPQVPSTAANSPKIGYYETGATDASWRTLGEKATNSLNYVDVDTATAGQVNVGLDSTTIKSYDGTTASNNTSLTAASQKLITEGVVKAYADTKVVQQLGAEIQSGQTASDDKDKLVYIGNDGKVAMSSMKVVDTVADGNANPVTSNAVHDYVQGITNGITLPEMPEECGQTGNYCALVVTGTGTAGSEAYTMDWTVMAQPSS